MEQSTAYRQLGRVESVPAPTDEEMREVFREMLQWWDEVVERASEEYPEATCEQIYEMASDVMTRAVRVRS